MTRPKSSQGILGSMTRSIALEPEHFLSYTHTQPLLQPRIRDLSKRPFVILSESPSCMCGFISIQPLLMSLNGVFSLFLLLLFALQLLLCYFLVASNNTVSDTTSRSSQICELFCVFVCGYVHEYRHCSNYILYN